MRGFAPRIVFWRVSCPHSGAHWVLSWFDSRPGLSGRSGECRLLSPVGVRPTAGRANPFPQPRRRWRGSVPVQGDHVRIVRRGIRRVTDIHLTYSFPFARGPATRESPLSSPCAASPPSDRTPGHRCARFPSASRRSRTMSVASEVPLTSRHSPEHRLERPSADPGSSGQRRQC